MNDKIVIIEGWKWKKKNFNFYDFWIAQDPKGKDWIIKFHGSFYSYREWAFKRICDLLGVNVRNSRLAFISKDELDRIGVNDKECFQSILEYIPGHESNKCRITCDINKLNETLSSSTDPCRDLLSINIENVLDIIKKDFLADLFGANEPSEFLISTQHIVYIIDNEQMFSQKPNGRISAQWITTIIGRKSSHGIAILKDLCKKLSEIPDETILTLLCTPKNYTVDMLWNIEPIIMKGKEIADSIRRGVIEV